MCMSITGGGGGGEEVSPRLLIQQKIYLSVLSLLTLILSSDCVLEQGLAPIGKQLIILDPCLYLVSKSDMYPQLKDLSVRFIIKSPSSTIPSSAR